MATPILRADSAPDNVVRLVPPPRPLRADVPPFDPKNPNHLRQWETLWDLGLYWSKRERGHV